MANALSSSPKPLRISVIIPARNEARVIGRCLEAIAQTRLAREEFEVILVDNESRDKTVAVAKTFASRFTLRILTGGKGYISALRNKGAAIARGHVLAFLDADCIPLPNWLPSALSLINEREIGITGSHYDIPVDATWVGRLWYKHRIAHKTGAVPYVPAGDLIIRGDLFRRIGGFDESLQTNEDFELCRRVAAAGLQVHSSEDLRVVHLGTPKTILEFFRKQRWHGAHVALVFFRNIKKGHNIRPLLLAVYFWFCLADALVCILGHWWLGAEVFASLIPVPAFILAIAASAGGNRGDVFGMSLLYFVYETARAISLLDYVVRCFRPLRTIEAQPSVGIHVSH